MLNMHFEESHENSHRNKQIYKLKEVSMPIAIFGTGKFAKSIAERLICNELEIIFFIDEEKYYYNDKKIEINGVEIPCIRYQEAVDSVELFNVLNGNIDAKICERLRRDFCRSHIIDYIDLYPTHYVTYDFLRENEKILEEIHNSMKDEKSKRILKAFFEGRYTGNVEKLCNLCSSNYLYDWDLLKISERDTIIDAGAYTGDTISEIKDYIGTFPRKIYAFEPDANNCIKLKNNFNSIENIEIISKGLYNKTDILSFVSLGTLGSRIVEDSENKIEVIALDDGGKYYDTSVIKMDIEGSEIEALYGAEKLIEIKHPRMAICIYHSNRDIIDIYLYLKRYGYNFYLRQHSNSVEETVLYAI